MVKFLIIVVGFLALPVFAAQSGEGSKADLAAMEKGFGWLIGQQGSDGGWHSSTYGTMRGGAALTSLVLYTTAQLPDEIVRPHAGAIRKGWAFLAPGLRRIGEVSAPDGETDFPTYSAGLLLHAMNRVDLGETHEDVQTLILYLCRIQLDEEHGFAPDSPDYGGWDLLGDIERVGKTTGSNISATRFVIEALSPHRKREDVTLALNRAGKWIGKVQNLDTDGGFYFHPEGSHLGNKAGWSDEEGTHPRSYGTCTADGLVALSILAEGATDPSGFEKPEKAAAAWLEKNPGVSKVPGFEFDPPETGWEQGLQFYYLMALSDAINRVTFEGATANRKAIMEYLSGAQSEGGAWKNDSARMREDDPVIATCFALAALGRLVER